MYDTDTKFPDSFFNPQIDGLYPPFLWVMPGGDLEGTSEPTRPAGATKGYMQGKDDPGRYDLLVDGPGPVPAPVAKTRWEALAQRLKDANPDTLPADWKADLDKEQRRRAKVAERKANEARDKARRERPLP